MTNSWSALLSQKFGKTKGVPLWKNYHPTMYLNQFLLVKLIRAYLVTIYSYLVAII